MMDWKKEALMHQRAAQDLNLLLHVAVARLGDSGNDEEMAEFLNDQCYFVNCDWLYRDLEALEDGYKTEDGEFDK